ncbi:hypothetical protein HK101_000424, partial [Irineochytrium annulatum]
MVEADTCAGKADGTAVCVGANTFNICLNGAQVNAPQTCATGTVCCAGSNKCDYAANCPAVASPSAAPATTPTTTPVVVAGSCAGIPDGGTVCTSSTQFNYCKGGAQIAAASQSCAPGTVCCASTNSCNFAASCPSVAANPPVQSPVAGTVFGTTFVGTAGVAQGPVVIPFTGASCSGVPNGGIRCLSGVTFGTCNNNVFVNAAQTPCAAGTVCCADSNLCDFQFNCKTIYPGAPPQPKTVCTGLADATQICMNYGQFTLCQLGSPTPLQNCAPGSVCCGNKCVMANDPLCGANYYGTPTVSNVGPQVTGAAGVVIVVSGIPPPYAYGSCIGVPNGYSVCSSSTAYSVCLNGFFVPGASTSCALGTVCCAATNQCMPAYQCPSVMPAAIPGAVVTAHQGSCQGQVDGATACTSALTFNFCKNGAFINAASQYCPTGTVCCANSNKCDLAQNCGYTLGATTVPTGNPLIGPGSCAGLVDGATVCTSTSSFNFCKGGVFVNAASQACPTGTVCCANSNKCDFASNCASVMPAAPAAPVGASGNCTGVPNNGVACTSSLTFNYCQNGAFISAASQYCPSGTVCCANSGRCDYPYNCQGQYASGTAASTTPVVQTPVTVPVGSCAGIADGLPACTSATTFNYCQGGAFIAGGGQGCAPGTVCCANTGRCNYLAACGSTLPYQIPLSGTAGSGVPSTAITLGSCANVVAGGTTCISGSTFNYCQNGAVMSAAPQNCPTGTVCCANSGKCDYSSNCGTLASFAISSAPTTTGLKLGSCAGVPDTQTSCTSASMFNTCVGGAFVSSPAQTCAPGTVCCADTGTCNYAANCPNNTPITAPVTPPATGSTAPSQTLGSCVGVPDTQTACTGPNTFNTCVGGAFVSSASQTCAPGTVCCANSGRCDYSTNCVSQVPAPAPNPVSSVPAMPVTVGSCAGIPNGGIVCTSSTGFNTCLNGAFVSAASTTCAPGTVCCANSNVCDFATNCKSQLPVAPATPITPATCAGAAANSIICTSALTFNYCVNGALVQAASQYCPTGTVCCATTGRCDYAYNCPTYAAAGAIPVTPASCSGIANGGTACTSQSTFNYCQNGIFINAASQSCPTGTVCCANSNVCDFASNCKAVLPATTSMVLGTCNAVNGTACTSAYTFNYCLNGAIVNAASQFCAPGTVCCANTGRCDFAYNCPSYYLGVGAVSAPAAIPYSCNGVPNGNIACTSSSTFNTCINGAFAPDNQVQKCAPGTVCCANTNKCDYFYNCNPIGPPPPQPQYGSCAGVPNNAPSCTSANTFNICEAGYFVGDKSQWCPSGTVCCADTGKCDYQGNCKAFLPGFTGVMNSPSPTPFIPGSPVVAPTPYVVSGPSCAGVANNNIVCTGPNTFNICSNGAFVTAASQSCPAGTVCCSNSNRCDFPANCLTTLPSVVAQPVAGVPAAGSPSFGSCAGVADNHIVCSTSTGFNYCLNGALVPGVQTCPSGTVCCANTGRCDFAYNCPSYYLG